MLDKIFEISVGLGIAAHIIWLLGFTSGHHSICQNKYVYLLTMLFTFWTYVYWFGNSNWHHNFSILWSGHSNKNS